MYFDLTEEQVMIRQMVRDFVTRYVAVQATDWDNEGAFPREIWALMAELGLLGLPFAEEVGGVGGDTISYAIAIEELARGSAGLALAYEAHVSLGAMPINLLATPAVREQWVPRCISGQSVACFGLTEPNAGSDAGGTQTTAVQDGDDWIINGTKCFITNATLSEVAVVTAVTDPGRGTKGISSFVVPCSTPGFSIGQTYAKMGLKCCDTAELVLEDCRVPADHMLGQRGRGFANFLSILDAGRVGVAALSVGIAQASLDASVKYAGERVQFGQPIARFQAIQFMLADMAAQVEASRLLTYQAAWLKDQGRPYTKQAAMAKLVASATAVRASLDAIQVFGGYGYMEEYLVERYLRDAKLMEIGEGTSEIQKLVIARELGCR